MFKIMNFKELNIKRLINILMLLVLIVLFVVNIMLVVNPSIGITLSARVKEISNSKQIKGFEQARKARIGKGVFLEPVLVSLIDKSFIEERKTYNTYIYIYEPHFMINGFAFLEQNGYRLNRLEYGKHYSKGVDDGAKSTSGGRINFLTNSQTISVKGLLDYILDEPWFSQYGASGLDVFVIKDGNKRLVDTVSPMKTYSRDFEQEMTISNGDFVEVEITLPQYARLLTLSIGLEIDSYIATANAYTNTKPIIFYGSSITQGASASHTSTSFPYLVAESLDADYINLGFSGSAKGEQSVAESIAKIDMSAFVMEYDHNAETPEELARTHYKFYRTIRNSRSDIPIVMLSRISGGLSISQEEALLRRDIIRNTYERAKDEGDKNVYFIDGGKLLADKRKDRYLADGKHPNDRGMAVIAEAVVEVLSK